MGIKRFWLVGISVVFVAAAVYGTLNFTSEYALGEDPKTSIELIEDTDGEQYAHLTFKRRIDDPFLQYVLEVSENLQSWQPANGNFELVSTIPLDTSFEEVTYKYLPPVSSADRRFFRVKVFIDSDLDGLPDEWEEEHGFDPFDPLDAILDFDGDSFSNLAEYYAGTSPHAFNSSHEASNWPANQVIKDAIAIAGGGDLLIVDPESSLYLAHEPELKLTTLAVTHEN